MDGEKFPFSFFCSSPDAFRTLLNRLREGVYFLDREKRIVFWNKAAEQLTGYREDEVLGRCCSDHILMHLDDQGTILCGERCPSSQCLADGYPMEFNSCFLHKEGYRVPGHVRLLPCRENAGKIVGVAQVFSDISPRLNMPPKTEELERLKLLDAQTESGNKRFLKIYLEARIEEMRKYRLPLGLLFVDIDNFANVNEIYGRIIGDKIIRMVAKSLANNARFTDVVGRWGEDQFLVVLLNVREEKLDVVANKLRLLTQRSGIPVGNAYLGVTVSIGFTEARQRDTVESLIDRAGKLMRHAKRLGKNRVCSRWPDEP